MRKKSSGRKRIRTIKLALLCSRLPLLPFPALALIQPEKTAASANKTRRLALATFAMRWRAVAPVSFIIPNDSCVLSNRSRIGEFIETQTSSLSAFLSDEICTFVVLDETRPHRSVSPSNRGKTKIEARAKIKWNRIYFFGASWWSAINSRAHSRPENEKMKFGLLLLIENDVHTKITINQTRCRSHPFSRFDHGVAIFRADRTIVWLMGIVNTAQIRWFRTALIDEKLENRQRRSDD